MPDYKENENTRELKSQIAQEKPRDQDGHFIKPQPPLDSLKPEAKVAQNPFTKFFRTNTQYSKSQDDLLDIHVGNPLGRIARLLEEIKQQKAFNFTVKGSLGIMGVFLALSVFGIFGGGKILCDKGTQVEIGTIKQLQVLQVDPGSSIPVLSQILDYLNPQQFRPKFILIKADESVTQLPYSATLNLTRFANSRVIATGQYDACAQTLTIKDPTAIEPLQ